MYYLISLNVNSQQACSANNGILLVQEQVCFLSVALFVGIFYKRVIYLIGEQSNSWTFNGPICSMQLCIDLDLRSRSRMIWSTLNMHVLISVAMVNSVIQDVGTVYVE